MAAATLALRVGEYVLVSEWWDEASFNSNKVHVALITKLSGESVRVFGAGKAYKAQGLAAVLLSPTRNVSLANTPILRSGFFFCS